jgi:hypothetical protein
MLNKELLKYQDRLFWIYKKMKKDQIKEDKIGMIQEFWHCDLVLKHATNEGEIFYFLREIVEVELID